MLSQKETSVFNDKADSRNILLDTEKVIQWGRISVLIAMVLQLILLALAVTHFLLYATYITRYPQSAGSQLLSGCIYIFSFLLHIYSFILAFKFPGFAGKFNKTQEQKYLTATLLYLKRYFQYGTIVFICAIGTNLWYLFKNIKSVLYYYP